ncbi:MAG TPA: hypothetical protein GXZ66_04355, partial [Clostridiaceae bacterium]|nr:hypothetical protein [Clostridiaceae bacterium]
KHDAGTFYGRFYTRNRSFSVLAAFGYKELADRAVGYANRKMMWLKFGERRQST